VNELGYRNKDNSLFKIGQDAYYIFLLKDNGNIVIGRTRIKSFVVKEDGVYIMSKYKYISIDNIYPEYDEAKEVIEKWQKEELNSRLRKEINL
jgi:hypothetical protein